MDGFNAAVDALSGAVFMKVPVLGAQIELIVLYLALPMLFFTLWPGFPNMTAVGRALRTLRAQPHAGAAHRDGSQWGVPSPALSGTIALGNTAGVAVALTVGGPGANRRTFDLGWFPLTVNMAEARNGR